MVFVAARLIPTPTRAASGRPFVCWVNRHEEVGNTGNVGEGFRMGWSRPAFYMFVIDVVIAIPTIIAVLVLILFGLSPLLLLLIDVTGVRVLAVVLTIGLMLLIIGVIVLAGIVVLDIVNIIDHWPAEETLAFIDRTEYAAGGPPHNAGAGLLKLGAPFPVTLLATSGDDTYGELMLASARSYGLDTSHVPIVPGAVPRRPDGDGGPAPASACWGRGVRSVSSRLRCR